MAAAIPSTNARGRTRFPARKFHYLAASTFDKATG